MKHATGLVEVVLVEGPHRIIDLLGHCDRETENWNEHFPGIPALWRPEYRAEFDAKLATLRLGEPIIFTTAIPTVAKEIGDFLDSIGFQVELKTHV